MIAIYILPQKLSSFTDIYPNTQGFEENKEFLETAEEMSDLAEEFEESTKLTRKMVEKLIDTVYAYDPKHYHIVFRFDDKIAKMREIVNLQ